MTGRRATSDKAVKRFDEICAELKTLRGTSRAPHWDTRKRKLFSEAKALYDHSPQVRRGLSFSDYCQSIGYVYGTATYQIRTYDNPFLRDYCEILGTAMCQHLLQHIEGVELSDSDVSNLKAFVDARRQYPDSEQLEMELTQEIYRVKQEHYEEFKRMLEISQVKSKVQEDLDSIEEEEGLPEGKPLGRYITYYERRPELRLAAILFHGTKCQVCGFDFAATYGEHGEGYIEVHHLRSVSSLGEETLVDPKVDMTVLCSNCHRMMHRKRDTILTPEELRVMLSRSK